MRGQEGAALAVCCRNDLLLNILAARRLPGPGTAVGTPAGRSAYAPGVGCREAILAVLPSVTAQDGTFSLASVVAALRAQGCRYGESTIRTHVTSRMCADAPDHHAKTYDDLERVGRGLYRLRERQ